MPIVVVLKALLDIFAICENLNVINTIPFLWIYSVNVVGFS